VPVFFAFPKAALWRSSMETVGSAGAIAPTLYQYLLLAMDSSHRICQQAGGRLKVRASLQVVMTGEGQVVGVVAFECVFLLN
jgi:glycerate kinase